MCAARTHPIYSVTLMRFGPAAAFAGDFFAGDFFALPPLPIGPPPKSLEPNCRVRGPGHSACVRFLARNMSAEAAERTKDLRELRLSGGMHGGVWGELKALLVMTPRRSLMLGGMAELTREAARRRRHENAISDETRAAPAPMISAPSSSHAFITSPTCPAAAARARALKRRV